MPLFPILSAAIVAASCPVPAATPVEIELVDPVDSKTGQRGNAFAIRLASPLLVNGSEVLAAGAAGQGQIVHAAKARALGKPGELLLAARWIEGEGVRVPLRGFTLAARGESNAGAALLLSPLSMFIVGGEVVFPAGTRGQARIAADIEIPRACGQTLQQGDVK